jgi:hypothetical protein
MSARRILASVPPNGSPLSPRREISVTLGSSVLLPADAISALALLSRRPSQRVSRSSSLAARKIAQSTNAAVQGCLQRVGVISGAPLCKQTFQGRAGPAPRY